MTDVKAPAEWKNYDDFAAGIATNRLPISTELVGRDFAISFDDGRRLRLHVKSSNILAWSDGGQKGEDTSDIINVAPNTYFLDVAFATLPTEAETIILNTKTGRALSIRSVVREAGANPGEPRVAQNFRAGVIDGIDPGASIIPAPTRDLIGLRAHYSYSPNHVYEHTYLSSQRYAWQCLAMLGGRSARAWRC